MASGVASMLKSIARPTGSAVKGLVKRASATTASQNCSSRRRAPEGPSISPAASAAAFSAPPEVPLTATMRITPSSCACSRLSSTPQPKAVWVPPPCRASATGTGSGFGGRGGRGERAMPGTLAAAGARPEGPPLAPAAARRETRAMPASDPACLSASDLLRLYRSRSLSPVEVTRAVLARIARLEPKLNAMVLTDEAGALAAAGGSEARWARGEPAGALDGVPATVKDLVDVKGFPTRRGSQVTDPSPRPEDAPAVAALRRAGAIILGKTTTTEFGWKSPGDCPHTGITRNPRNPAHTPGGSSCGAGAAAAAGYGPLHIGTDAGGSIRIPAAWSGVVGVKPSFGRVPQWPLGAFGPVAVAGPMARSVTDAALMLSAMAGFDWRDPFSLPDPPRDFSAGLEDGVAGLRVGILRRPGFDAPATAAMWQAVERAADALRAQGAAVAEAEVELPDTRKIFARVWGLALARLTELVPPDRHALLDRGILRVRDLARDQPPTAYLDAEAMRVELAHRLARLHAERFDVLLSPCVPDVAPRADAPLDRPEELLWSAWAPWTFTYNLSRQPAVSVPAGLDANGLPLAVQVAAALYRDDLALRAARAVERALGEIPVAEPS
jgi:aspartyl-tRNA(Asn)/glutamyl-tRNA(Gln) amidotransferase subunit A